MGPPSRAPGSARLARAASITLEEALAENERLRRELAKATGGQQTDGPAEPAARRLQLRRRGFGKPLDPRAWHAERLEQQQQQGVRRKRGEDEEQAPFGGEGGSEDAVMVPREASPDAPPVPDELDEVGASAAPAPAEAKPLSHPWISQPSLVGASGENWSACQPELRALLKGLAEDLLQGRRDAARRRAEEAMDLHLSRRDWPPLALSAALVPLCGLLAARPFDGAPAAARCAAYAEGGGLWRGLVARSGFGDRPPRKRPEGVPRSRHIRELCTQVGLSLDLVRLAYAERHARRALEGAQSASEAPGPAPLQDAGGAMTMQVEPEPRPTSFDATPPAGGTSPPPPPTAEPAVAAEEREAHLKRAGHFLAALQMDMDLEHDLAVKQMREAEVARASAHGERGPGEDIPETGGEPAARQGGEAPPPPRPAAEPPTGLQADPSLNPSFGEFLSSHVLPLYVADIPFAYMRRLVEHFCSAPIDSDDEERSWKALGIFQEEARVGAAARAKKDPPRLPRRATSGASTPPLLASQPAASPPETASEAEGVEPPILDGADGLLRTPLVEPRKREGLHRLASNSTLGKRTVELGRGGARRGRGPATSAANPLLSTSSASAPGGPMRAPATPARASLALPQALFMAPGTPFVGQDMPTPLTAHSKCRSRMGDLRAFESPSRATDWGLLDTPKAKTKS